MLHDALRVESQPQKRDEYPYVHCESSESAAYLLEPVLQLIRAERRLRGALRLFEVGCGNGAVAAVLHREGFGVTAVDSSQSGIDIARREHPDVRFETASAYDDLAERFGTFPMVVSLEVVEHLYAPRKFASSVFDLLEPGGLLIASTPYHGYIKNVVLALSGRLDKHFTALWDHGHIKFWSETTLAELLREAGFCSITFKRVGRVPVIAKSMIACARRPAGPPSAVTA